MAENNRDDKDVAGKGGFTWWTGIVEDKQDPLKLGRCRVRCIEWHSDNKMAVPTEMLPWAMPALPINNTNVYAPKEGDMVFGFFMDGEAAQNPVMLGIFPSIPLKEPNSQNAFADSRNAESLANAPRKPKVKTYKVDGSGIEMEESDKGVNYPANLDEPTTSRLARNESIDQTFIKERKDNKVTSVPTVNSTWDEPETQYAAKYPYNNVMESESGHIMEFDDTAGKERIHLAHRSGTFFEMYPDGTKVEKIVRDNFQIIMKDDNVYIMGKCNITVQGDAEVYVKKDAFVKVDNNVKVEVGGNYDEHVSGTYKVRSDGNMSLSAPNVNLNADGSIRGGAGNSIGLTAPRVDLN